MANFNFVSRNFNADFFNEPFLGPGAKSKLYFLSQTRTEPFSFGQSQGGFCWEKYLSQIRMEAILYWPEPKVRLSLLAFFSMPLYWSLFEIETSFAVTVRRSLYFGARPGCEPFFLKCNSYMGRFLLVGKIELVGKVYTECLRY